MIELYNIVTSNSDTHKRVINLYGNNAILEFYSEVGRETEDVPLAKCKFVSEKITKQFIEMKSLYEKGKESFYSEREANRKRTQMRELLRRKKSLTLKKG